MHILILLLCISATLAITPANTTTSLGCGGDINAESKPCGDPCPITCDNKDQTGPRICPDICILNGCGCKSGYVKDINEKCILPKNCPPSTCSGPNEIYSSCKDPCQSCENLSGLVCEVPVNCLPGCNCIDGYLRNAHGVCIEELKCPCSDPNAVRVECPNPCPRTCDNLLNKTKICTRLCVYQGCTCKNGFVLNSLGKCIKPEQCPPKKCPANEEYNACPAVCSFEANCATYVQGLKILCVQTPNKGICKPRCQCKTGFVRIDGKCVSPSKCCVEPNTQLVNCPAPCEATCFSIPEPNCKVKCPARKCICARGYVRSGQKCIRKKDCPPACPGKNEVYSACKDPCPETCEEITSGIPGPICLLPNPCKGGCNCKDGYVRNDNGNCVNINYCPCPDPNAVLKYCPNPCPPTCEDLEGTKPCPRACIARGCTCRYGFVLNSTGKCVKPDQCPKKCEANEEFQEDE